MKFSCNKGDFVNKLLQPVSKLADNLLLETFERENHFFLKTAVSSADNSIILFSTIPCETTNDFKCIIPDCKTFLRLFSGIEERNIDLEIDANTIFYKNSTFSFKYHLLDESYLVNKKTFSQQKLEALEYDTHFCLTKGKLAEIVKFNSIVPDVEKLYFFTEDNKVFAKIGDKEKHNTNEIVVEICPSFEGTALLENLPLNIQNILLFSFSEDVVNIAINHKLKIFKFQTSELKYIVSGLVK
jgi:hypothetical protein